MKRSARPWGDKIRRHRHQDDVSDKFFSVPRIPTDRRSGDLVVNDVTVQDLYRWSDPNTVKAALGVQIASASGIKAPASLDKLGYKCLKVTCFTEDNTHKHVTQIMFRTPHLLPTSPVLISCDCPAYKFTWEYANAYGGCGFLLYSNGKKPTTTNPGLQIGACKHVFRALNMAMRLKRIDKFGNQVDRRGNPLKD